MGEFEEKAEEKTSEDGLFEAELEVIMEIEAEGQSEEEVINRDVKIGLSEGGEISRRLREIEASVREKVGNKLAGNKLGAGRGHGGDFSGVGEGQNDEKISASQIECERVNDESFPESDGAVFVVLTK